MKTEQNVRKYTIKYKRMDWNKGLGTLAFGLALFTLIYTLYLLILGIGTMV